MDGPPPVNSQAPRHRRRHHTLFTLTFIIHNLQKISLERKRRSGEFRAFLSIRVPRILFHKECEVFDFDEAFYFLRSLREGVHGKWTIL